MRKTIKMAELATMKMPRSTNHSTGWARCPRLMPIQPMLRLSWCRVLIQFGTANTDAGSEDPAARCYPGTPLHHLLRRFSGSE